MMDLQVQTTQAKQLVFIGLLLFLFGLVIGLFNQQMANPRMGVSAHLEGLLNGMFLMILGLVWKYVFLSRPLLKATYWMLIYGAFANLIAVTIAAITGFGKMMPIAGGKEGIGLLENLISFLLVTLALSMVGACALLLVGIYKHIKQQ